MSLEGKSAEEIASLAELAMQLSSNPKTRQGFLHLSKQANPEAHIPEIDIPVQVRGMMDAGVKRLEAAEKEVRDMKAERSILARRESLIESGKASKRDIAAIEKLMVDKQIPDHETAAEFYALQQKSAEPTPANARQTVRESTMPTVDLKSFKGNLNEWARNMASKALDDIRGQGKIRI